VRDCLCTAGVRLVESAVKPSRRITKARESGEPAGLGTTTARGLNLSGGILGNDGSASIIAPGREGSQLPVQNHQGPQGLHVQRALALLPGEQPPRQQYRR
jgi:hypothetical protein